MTIKELKEELSKYDENTNVSFWEIEDAYYDFIFIDDDPLQNYNRIDIILKIQEKDVN